MEYLKTFGWVALGTVACHYLFKFLGNIKMSYEGRGNAQHL
jgi:hypothetical protein